MGHEFTSDFFSLRILLIYFQAITLQARGRSNVSSALFQRRDAETTLNYGYFKPLCLQIIYLNVHTRLFMNTG